MPAACRRQRLLVACLVALAGALVQPGSSAQLLLYPSSTCMGVVELVKLGHTLLHRGHAVTVLVADSCMDEVQTAKHLYDEPEPSTASAASACSKEEGQEQAGSCRAPEVPMLNILTYMATHKPSDFLARKDDVTDSVSASLARSTTSALANCAALLTNRTAMATLSAAHFSLVVGDVTDPCSWLVADALEVVRVDYDPSGTPTVQRTAYGVPFPLAYVAALGSGLPGGLLTFHERVANILQQAKVMWAHHRVVTPAIAAFRKRYRTLHPGLWHHNRRADPRLGTVLCLAAADWAVQEPYPVPPLVKHVGPLLPGPAKPLPPELQTFLDGAEQGVVVAWMSSGYKIPGRALMALGEAFVETPMRVVWLLPQALKAKLALIYGPVLQSTSVLIEADLPINDIIAHPRVVSVLSDGAMPHVYTALWHGKPLLAVPVSLEQRDTVARLLRLGVAKQLTREHLERGLAFMVEHALGRLAAGGHTGAYTQRAAAVGQRLRAIRPTPVEAAAQWVEYALASSQTPMLLHTMSIWLPWWREALLDVLLAVVLLVLLMAWAVTKLGRRLFGGRGGGRPQGPGGPRGRGGEKED